MTSAGLAQQPRIVQAIDANRTIELQKHIHPLARPEFDRGPADPAFRLGYVTLVLKPTTTQQSDLEALLVEQQDRSSPNFHKWLTPEQFGIRFGIASTDLAMIRSWLQGQGLHVEDTARGRNWIAFSGTATQVQHALHTEIHHFRVNSKDHYANVTNPSVPAAIAGLVRFFRGLDDFEPEAQSTVAPDNTSSGGSHSMAPDDFATIYNLTPLYDNNLMGDGQSIAVLGRTNIDMAGYQTFRSTYHLSATEPVMHLVGIDPGTSQSDLGEAMLDLEWSGAVARNATLIYVYAVSVNTAAQEAIDKNLAPVMSESYGSCEPMTPDTLRYLAQQAAAQGITWVVSGGDAGAASCDKHGGRALASAGLAVSYPASIPEITAVGGTMFNEGSGSYWNTSNTTNGASVKSYIPEVVWNENSLGGGLSSGGGGASILYPKPMWQNGPGVPGDSARDLPDLSLTAASHDAYRTYFNKTNFVSWGTSAAAPSFAGMVALLNQYQVQNGLQSAPGMGNINPGLYRLAQSFPAAFHDITAGNDNVPCVQSSPGCLNGSLGFPAAANYDQASGLGSVDAANLITHWNQNGAASTTTVAPTASSYPFGTKAQLTATVASGSGSGTPTGTVYFQIPNGGIGTVDLGSATLSNGTATISVDPNQLFVGSDKVIAFYSGDNNFDTSSGTTTFTVDAPPGKAAAIVVTVSPNPVYALASTTGIASWNCTITLSEQAGVAATLTGFNAGGTDESTRLSTFFTNGTKIPASGSLIGGLSYTNLTTPTTRVFAFNGTDANGNTWKQQVTVSFVGSHLQPEILLSASPANVQRNPSADPSCPWMQHLYVQEVGGFNMQLYKFIAGTKDLTSQISQYFGTTELAPFGALQATVCSTGSTPPAAMSYELDGQSDGGTLFRTTLQTTYAAAAASPATLATEQKQVDLSMPGSSGSATAPINVSFAGTSNWNASIFPNNATTSWLKISPASGSSSGVITLTANAAGVSPGVYRAMVIVQGSNSLPQFIEVPVTLTVGASSDISIGGVTNGASFQQAYAPGMVLSVFGTGLAPEVQLAGALPLPLSMQGVSATVNGYAAPLYYVSPGQINLQVPYETGARTAVVGINNNGKVASFIFNTTPTAPGIFVQDGNLVPKSTGKPGDVLTLFMTGEGDVTPGLFTGSSPAGGTPVANLPAPRIPVGVTVSGIPATTQFIGIPSLLVGTTQINFVIPDGVPAGPQPVVVTSNGVASAPATINVGN
ncbi:MAG TPA: protease pro-enzyme activation domain-containing protein [Bryobacteraceae bacterium]